MSKPDEQQLDFPISLLQTFFLLAEYQNIVMTARKLSIDKRTIRNRLDDLEACLRTVLFTSMQFFELSEAGEKLISAAIPVLGQLMTNTHCDTSLDKLNLNGIHFLHLEEAVALSNEGAFKRIYGIPADGSKAFETDRTQALRLHIKKLETLVGEKIFEGWSSIKTTRFGDDFISEIRPSLEIIKSLRYPLLTIQEDQQFMLQKAMREINRRKVLLIKSIQILERRDRLSVARKNDLERMKLSLAAGNKMIKYLIELGAKDLFNASHIDIDLRKPDNEGGSSS